MSTTTNAVVGTAAIVTVGKWVSDDEEMDAGVVVGGVILALSLALIEQANPQLAKRFAVLILVVAMFMYVPEIAFAAGLTNSRPQWSGKVRRRVRRRKSRSVSI